MSDSSDSSESNPNSLIDTYEAEQTARRRENEGKSNIWLPFKHGWAGMTVVGDSWEQFCIEGCTEHDEIAEELPLCEQCEKLKEMMEDSRNRGGEEPNPDGDRVLHLGSSEEIRSRGPSCYCCRSFIWLMNEYGIPLDKKVCVHFVIAGRPGQLTVHVAFPEEFQDKHTYYQHKADTKKLVLYPFDPDYGLETHARVYDPHTINLGYLKEWISHCEEHHQTRCPSGHKVPLEAKDSSPDPLEQILLLDLEQECIVTAPFDVRYVALSYVWGGATAVLTTSNNFDEICQLGSLSEEMGKFALPKTIKDAMLLARLLGEKFLWVDSVCIIQDEGALKQRYLKAMASIYANAYFTIVAAEGNDADHGIRGLGPGTQDREVPCNVVDLPYCSPMMVTEEEKISAYPIRSTWAARGWTFQESMFSKRLLIMDRLVAWICGGGVGLEELEDRWGRDWVFSEEDVCGLYQNVSKKTNIGFWGQTVGSFNKRALTYEGDIIDSFAGVNTVMSQSFPGGILHGLPVEAFEIGLLWQSQGPVVRRSAVDKRGKKLPLPSWSWLGWSGYLNCEIWHEAWLGIQYPDSRRTQISPVVQWLNKAPTQPDQAHHVREDGLQGLNLEDLSKAKEWVPKSGPIPFAKYIGETTSEEDIHLHFRTQLATLAVGRVLAGSLATRPGNVVAEFVDKEGRTIGAMLPNLPVDSITTGTRCKLIAISMGKIRHSLREKYPVHFLSNADWKLRAWTENIGLETQEDEWFEFYNVLWVEWVDGVAYRKALGRVIKPAWSRLDLETVDVMLG